MSLDSLKLSLQFRQLTLLGGTFRLGRLVCFAEFTEVDLRSLRNALIRLDSFQRVGLLSGAAAEGAS